MPTSGEPNAAVLRRIEDAWRRRDVEGILAEADPDVEIHPVAELTGGPYVGHDGIRRYIADADALDELHFDLAEMRDAGDRVIVLGRYRSRSGGALSDSPAGWVVTLHDGKLRSSRAYPSWAEAIEEGER
jgi:ketosteroid isomerase-like protein